mgnify:CR=1 FL=1
MEFVVRSAVRGHGITHCRFAASSSSFCRCLSMRWLHRASGSPPPPGPAALLISPRPFHWSNPNLAVGAVAETPKLLSTAASSEESAQTHRARRSASVYLVVSRRIRERACPPERWWVERGGDAPSGRSNRPPATPTRRGPDTTTSYIIEMPPRKRPAEPTRARIRRSAPASRASPRAFSPTR